MEMAFRAGVDQAQRSEALEHVLREGASTREVLGLPRGGVSTEGQGSVDFDGMRVWGEVRAIRAGGAGRSRPVGTSVARRSSAPAGGGLLTALPSPTCDERVKATSTNL
jgi:hypothetical protein